VGLSDEVIYYLQRLGFFLQLLSNKIKIMNIGKIAIKAKAQ
jgi:hypothetical protein